MLKPSFWLLWEILCSTFTGQHFLLLCFISICLLFALQSTFAAHLGLLIACLNWVTIAVVFLPKPSHGDFGQFFPTGTYTGKGTSVSSLKHVMKSTTKKIMLALILNWLAHVQYLGKGRVSGIQNIHYSDPRIPKSNLDVFPGSEDQGYNKWFNLHLRDVVMRLQGTKLAIINETITD